MIAALVALLRRSVPCTPRVCDRCGRVVTRLTPGQCDHVRSKRLPRCRRWGCDGRLYPVWSDAETETFVRVLSAEETRLNKTAAPGESGAAAEPNGWKEPKDMTTIIQRHARELHAGDVIVHDPDHDRPVRWRVSRPPVITGDGEYALADYLDLDVNRHGILYFRVLANLSVEPVGGAQ